MLSVPQREPGAVGERNFRSLEGIVVGPNGGWELWVGAVWLCVQCVAGYGRDWELRGGWSAEGPDGVCVWVWGVGAV
jgi:hypothetical protein